MTQIIERVARAMCAADVPRPFDELQECDQDDYRDMAQAALKEIKLDELVGALEKTSACISYMNRDVKGVAEEYLGFWPDDIQDEAYALLSELEKTDA